MEWVVSSFIIYFLIAFFSPAFNWKAKRELTLTDFYFVNFTFLGSFSLKIWSTFLHVSFKCWFLGDRGCSTDLLLSHHVLQSSLLESQGNTSVDYTIQKGPVTPLTFTFPNVPSTTSPKCLVITRNGTIHEITSPATWLWLQSLSSYNSFYLDFYCTRRGEPSEGWWSCPVRQAESRVGEVRGGTI